MSDVLTIALAGALSLAQEAGAVQKGSLSDLRLTLSADRVDYVVGEPVRLTLTVRNIGSQRVIGYFMLLSGYEETDLYYRRGRREFIRLDPPPSGRPRPHADVIRIPWSVLPGDEKKDDVILARNPYSGAPILDAPGKYQFRVVCRPWWEFGDEFDTRVEVEVDWPPHGQRDALDQYVRERLVGLVERPLSYPREDRAALKRAAGFLELHGNTIYGKHVRASLIRALQHLTARNSATPVEKELYQALRVEAER